MGLHRYITFSVDGLPDDNEFVQASADLIEEMYDLKFEDANRIEDVNWYDIDDDMKEFSAFFPAALFIMDVDEGGVERWKGYYKNGKMQFCGGEIVYDEFDESKLK